MALFNGRLFGGQLYAGQLFAGDVQPPIIIVPPDGGGGITYRRPWRVRRRRRLYPELDEYYEQRLQEDEIILAILINAVTRNML
jgi:hypothetical protein